MVEAKKCARCGTMYIAEAEVCGRCQKKDGVDLPAEYYYDIEN